MNTTKTPKFSFHGQRGSVFVFVVVSLVALVGVGALAVDVSAWQVTRSELQRAADAGALAGARALYLPDGSAVDPGANAVAQTAATENRTTWGGLVEVGAEDVERGHWSFGLGNRPEGFTPNNSLTSIELAKFTEVELDENVNFINAVRVVSRRQDTTFPLFFSRLFLQNGFPGSREAVAYLGFSGNLEEDEIFIPLAICEENIVTQTAEGGKVECNVGNYLSGTEQTARWTNFGQPCSGAANSSDVRNLMADNCTTGNPAPIFFGQGVTTMEGSQASAGFSGPNNLHECWLASDPPPEAQNVPKGSNKGPTEPFPNDPWKVKLLVVDCEGPESTNTCKPAKGVITVDVLWSMRTNEHAQGYVPVEMSGLPQIGIDDWGDPVNYELDYLTRWADFVDRFRIQDSDGTDAPYEPFTLYFSKDCSYETPTGGTGGINYGVLARIPVLVR